MKGKIILGLGTISVTASTLSMVACGNTNKPKKDSGDSDTAKSTQVKHKYPELTRSLATRMKNSLRDFVLEKGTSYFDKYISHFDKAKRIYLDYNQEWFLYSGWGKAGINGSIVINYREAYDWLHQNMNPKFYPYLND